MLDKEHSAFNWVIKATKYQNWWKYLESARFTIYNGFNHWESEGLVGLYNHPGQGRKKMFDIQQQKIIKSWVKETPKTLGRVRDKIEKEWGIIASKDTIKRVIKSDKMKWIRIKKRVGGEPLPEFYSQKTRELEELKPR